MGPAIPPAHPGRPTFLPVSEPPMRASKIQPPPLREDILPRARLLDWLDAKIHRRVVTLVAEAGYGKTTLLADFARRTRIRVIWHQLDDDDLDIVTFVRYLLAACRRVVPELGEVTAGLLRDIGTLATPASVLVDTFVREMGALADQPTILVFDDTQALERSPEVQRALREIVARAPDRTTVVLSGRRRAPVGLARLRTHGEVAELTADDLRFDHEETEALFRETYGRPLDRESLDALERRTDGWVASLNLVRAAIRDRSDADTRRFIRDLSAAEGPLYDYLAEEVVGDLPRPLQSFLMRTALLVEVEVGLASVAAEIDRRAAEDHIDQAEQLGLLSAGRGRGRAGGQYHPLVRQFLSARLAREIGIDGVRAVHRRIAAAAETTDWRRAAHHYAEADDGADLYRVLVEATRSIMASGDYSFAESYIVRFPDADSTPWFDIVLSRRELRSGRVAEAVRRAERAVAALDAAGPDRHLALANLMSVNFYAGDLDAARDLAITVSRLDHEPSLAPLALGMIALIDVSRGGSVAVLEERLRAALALQIDAGASHYRGVTLLNLTVVYRLQGRAELALNCADEALTEFGDTAASLERVSAHLARAWALAHLNRLTEAEQEIQVARRTIGDGRPDEVLSEGGDVLGCYVEPARADIWLDQDADRRWDAWMPGLSMTAIVRAENKIRLGSLDDAERLLRTVDEAGASIDIGLMSRRAVAEAVIATRKSLPTATDLAREAVAVASAQGATYWLIKAQLTLAAASMDPSRMSEAVIAVARTDRALLTAFAEVVAPYLGFLNPDASSTVAAVAAEWPTRWAAALRQAVQDGDADLVLAAARLLESIGSREDVTALRTAGRRVRKQRDVEVSVRQLTRRVAPRVRVQDLGPVTVAVGGVVLPGSSIRRKVLSLLCFMCSRPEMTATRDQVLEAIWPDLTPELASNSLNQTVYFLRRVFEPKYRDDTSPGYVMSDQDMVWLDSELVTASSRDSLSALRNMTTANVRETARVLAATYTGRYALDFEYEEWATGYRDNLHARYLDVMERAVLKHAETGDYAEAVALAQRVLDVDPTADSVERAAIRLYREMGAFAAAAEQYAHYAQMQRSVYGVEAPAIDAI